MLASMTLAATILMLFEHARTLLGHKHNSTVEYETVVLRNQIQDRKTRMVEDELRAATVTTTVGSRGRHAGYEGHQKFCS
jgi:hypothetical protein